MSEFTVHSHPGSPFGRSVMATLEEKGAPFRLARLAPKSPEHLALHPIGRIPVLLHDGFRLYETAAILRYLERTLPSPALVPFESRSAARMDQVMNINDWYLFQGAGSVIAFQRIVGPRLRGLTPDEALIGAAMPRAGQAIDALARELGAQTYFVGEAPSLADILLAPQLDFLSATPEWATLSAGHTALAAWLARMNARPSLAATTWERVAQLARAA